MATDPMRAMQRASEQAIASYEQHGTRGLVADVAECWAQGPGAYCMYLDMVARQVEVAVALDNGVPVHSFFARTATVQRAQAVLRRASGDPLTQHRYWEALDAQTYAIVQTALAHTPLDVLPR